MAKKVKKGQFWITCIGEIIEIKFVKWGDVIGQGYTRQGTRVDDYERMKVKDLLNIAKPCAVSKMQLFDENGSLITETVEKIEVK